MASGSAEVGGKQLFRPLRSLDVFAGCGGQNTSAKCSCSSLCVLCVLSILNHFQVHP